MSLLDSLLQEEQKKWFIKSCNVFLACTAQNPAWDKRPKDWAPDWCHGWHFALPHCFADALGIRLTERSKTYYYLDEKGDRIPERDEHGNIKTTPKGKVIYKKRVERQRIWTQATTFDFRAGYFFCDKVLDYCSWGEALPQITCGISVVDAMPASAAQGENVARNPGYVVFTVYKKSADGLQLVPSERHTVTQDDFVRYLISGKIIPGQNELNTSELLTQGSYKMNSFNEIYTKIITEKCLPANLLLGNGFSIAASKSFNYRTIFEKSHFEENYAWIKNISNTYNTVNFELVIEMLSHAEKVNRCSGDTSVSDKDRDGKNALIDIFINALTSIHPEKTSITTSQYDNNKEFIKKFDYIFTLNYDILLYRSICNNRLTSKFRDNFLPEDDIYSFDKENQDTTNLWFLHGAFHLRRNYDGTIYKVIYTEGSNIINKLKKNIQNGIYPVIVFEGTDEEKLSKINSNYYLHSALRAFSNMTGSLFVCGFSFNNNDKHVIDAIVKSKISHLCVGLYGDENSSPNTLIKEQCEIIRLKKEQQKEQMTIDFFDVDTAAMW